MRVSSVLLFGCGFLLSACTLVAPPSPAGTYTYGSSTVEASTFIEGQIKKCWVKEATFWSDGRVYRKTNLESVTLFELRRYRPSLNDLNPFLVVTIAEKEPGNVMISVEEGDYVIGSHLGLASDVNRWVKGDVSCSNIG